MKISDELQNAIKIISFIVSFIGIVIGVLGVMFMCNIGLSFVCFLLSTARRSWC